MSCGRIIPWYDLVPIFSWIILRGRCRLCGACVSLQYILVEVSLGLLFLAIGFAPLPLYERLSALPIIAILFAIAVYDFKNTLIPDAWVYFFAVFSLGASLISVVLGESENGVSQVLLAGPIVAMPLFAFWFFSKGAWMGFGDVKLALGMGWLLGIGDGLFALFLAFVLGAFVSVPLLFFSSSAWGRISVRITHRNVSRKLPFTYTMKSEIPFGPFLISATLIVWIANMYGLALINLVL